MRFSCRPGRALAPSCPTNRTRKAGASVVPADQLASADAILMVGRPDAAQIARLRSGQGLLGMFAPLTDPELVARLAETGATAISLDLIPRTLSRAQPMDALSSQANIAGYKAALLAAAAYGRFFPMLITAAGTARPAKVLVLGTGVAGLQAIGTARRLGAVVSAYDVRPETRTEVESLGATFIELTSVGPASGTGGYARALTDAERAAQQAELTDHIARHDVVITTAQVPGRRPPLLVTGEALKSMAPGSVLVDMGASTLGGNVEGSVPGETIVADNGSRSSAPTTCRRRWPPRPRRCTRATSARCCSTWSRTARSPSTWPTSWSPESWSRTRARSCTLADYLAALAEQAEPAQSPAAE